MVAKARVLTRSFDVSVEGETVEDVDRLLKALEDRGLSPAGATQALPRPSDSVLRDTTHSASSTVDTKAEELAGPSIGTLDSFSPAGSPATLVPEASIFKSVTKQDGDVFFLSPKFPPSATGAERVADAAMVVLGAYDASGAHGATGYFLVQSLRQTGYSLERVDVHLNDLVRKGLVLVEGVKRGRRYALSEAGRVEARRLAAELAALSGRSTGATP